MPRLKLKLLELEHLRLLCLWWLQKSHTSYTTILASIVICLKREIEWWHILFYDLASKVTVCNFCHILLLETNVIQIGPGSRDGNVEPPLNRSTSLSHSKKSMWNGKCTGATIFWKMRPATPFLLLTLKNLHEIY
jgi:hypothetical protein